MDIVCTLGVSYFFNPPRKHNRRELLNCGVGSSQRRMWEKCSRMSDTRGLLGPQRKVQPKDQGLTGAGAGVDVRHGMSWTEEFRTRTEKA